MAIRWCTNQCISITTPWDFIKSIKNYDGAKVLISVPSSKVMNKMLGQTKLLSQLKDLGYDVLHITSKFGAYVNQTKVNRTTFFNTLKEWGCQTARKFVIFHYSILSEGINVSDYLTLYCCEILTSWRCRKLSVELLGYTKKINKILLKVLFLVGLLVCIVNPAVIVLFLLTKIMAQRLLIEYKGL